MNNANASNTQRGRMFGIKTTLVFTVLLGFGLASCDNELVQPQSKKLKSAKGLPATHADGGDDLAPKPPKEPFGGG